MAAIVVVGCGDQSEPGSAVFSHLHFSQQAEVSKATGALV